MHLSWHVMPLIVVCLSPAFEAPPFPRVVDCEGVMDGKKVLVTSP